MYHYNKIKSYKKVFNTYFCCLLIVILTTAGCDNFSKKKSFYEKSYDNGLQCLPLIKPYKVKYYGEFKWFLEIDTTFYVVYPNEFPTYAYSQINDIIDIDVKDSLVFIRSNSTKILIDSVIYQYFLIKPYKKEEIAFANEDSLLLYLGKQRTNVLPNWKKVDETWKKFNETSVLPWANFSNKPEK